MKRLSGNDEDRHSYEEKDWGRRDEEPGSQRSGSSFQRSGDYYKRSDSGRKVVSSSRSRYDRLEDGKDGARMVRRRSDYDIHERRMGSGRQRDGVSSSSSPKTDHFYRHESFSGTRTRDFAQDFRSDKYRAKREGIDASWRRLGSGKDGDDAGRGSIESGRATRTETKEMGISSSPRGSRDPKSPAWSKDSGSDHSKSVDTNLNAHNASSIPSGEPEEGELEPDHHVLLAKPIYEIQSALNSSEKEAAVEEHVGSKLSQDEANIFSEGNKNPNNVENSEEKAESRLLLDAKGAVDKGVCQSFQDKSFPEEVENRDKGSGDGENECSNKVEDTRDDAQFIEVSNKTPSLPEKTDNETFKDQVKKDANILEIGEIEMFSKEKGKGVSLAATSCFQLTDTNLELEGGVKMLQKSGDIEMEGPSSRGFQFLSNDPINKLETVEQLPTQDDKLALELSLSLPNVLFPIGSQNRGMNQSSPSQTRSFHSFGSSFRTLSDGLTGSMSFSGSQQFTHNPSCSLSHNVRDNEQSVKSKPLFKGVDWKALADEENMNKDSLSYQNLPSNNNEMRQLSESAKRDANGEAMVKHKRVMLESSQPLNGSDSDLVLNKHFSSDSHYSSYENRYEHSKERRKFILETDNSSLQRSKTHGSDFAESMVTMAVSEPINMMSQKFSEMSSEKLTSVKEFIHEMILNPVKQWKLSSFQNALVKRQDISLDMLLNAHRGQLEILVALKTGLEQFILKKCDIPTPELAEIFLNMRCRNLKCRSLLPVDECDCKICTKCSDFCRECMCLVCSKFDNAQNTCSWVGCDLCLHWCHADCGLRESHIRNGCRVGGVGNTEVHFYCVACGHASEMFGFVKEVFLNFVNEWTAQNLSQELEYVRRIFAHSEDPRGKQVHELAVQMKSKLADRMDLHDIRKLIMKFFTESISDKPRDIAVDPINRLTMNIQENANVNVGSIQGATWLTSYHQNETPILESSLPEFGQHSFSGGNITKLEDTRKNVAKEAAFIELESVVRIKFAEANMFQDRADDARRESEALRRISNTKRERIEEEFNSRIKRLRLPEAEEMRKQKIAELQDAEREYQEYITMKMRMEGEIKELLLKMEAKRRNLAT